MTNGGKKALGWLFVVLAIVAGLGYIVFNSQYSGTVSGVSALAAFILFKVASTDKASQPDNSSSEPPVGEAG